MRRVHPLAFKYVWAIVNALIVLHRRVRIRGREDLE